MTEMREKPCSVIGKEKYICTDKKCGSVVIRPRRAQANPVCDCDQKPPKKAKKAPKKRSMAAVEEAAKKVVSLKGTAKVKSEAKVKAADPEESTEEPAPEEDGAIAKPLSKEMKGAFPE